MTPAEIEQLILKGLPGAETHVTGDDGAHFEALVVAPVFAGKRPLARHQLVYAVLGERLGRDIHALSLRTLTPEEARTQADDTD